MLTHTFSPTHPNSPSYPPPPHTPPHTQTLPLVVVLPHSESKSVSMSETSLVCVVHSVRQCHNDDTSFPKYFCEVPSELHYHHPVNVRVYCRLFVVDFHHSFIGMPGAKQPYLCRETTVVCVCPLLTLPRCPQSFIDACFLLINPSITPCLSISNQQNNNCRARNYFPICRYQ